MSHKFHFFYAFWQLQTSQRRDLINFFDSQNPQGPNLLPHAFDSCATQRLQLSFYLLSRPQVSALSLCCN